MLENTDVEIVTDLILDEILANCYSNYTALNDIYKRLQQKSDYLFGCAPVSVNEKEKEPPGGILDRIKEGQNSERKAIAYIAEEVTKIEGM